MDGTWECKVCKKTIKITGNTKEIEIASPQNLKTSLGSPSSRVLTISFAPSHVGCQLALPPNKIDYSQLIKVG